MSHRRFAPALVPGVCLLACTLFASSATADSVPQPEIPDGWPKWMQKAMKKETRSKKATSFADESGAFTGKILGKLLLEPVAFDGGYYVGSELVSSEPFTCYAYTGHRNLANTVESLQRSMIDNLIEKNGGELKQRIPYYVHSGVIGDVPFLTTEWLYTVETEDGVKVGLNKIRAAKKNGATLVCVHLDLGYRKTFARLFEGFVEETEVAMDQPEPYYREVLTLTLAGQPAGVATASFVLDEQGDTRIDLMTAMLMRVDSRTVMTSDTSKLEFSTPDGRLINAYDFTVENGEVSNELSLAYDDQSGWMVQGAFGGKDIAVVLEAAEPPRSTLGQMYAVRAALATDAGRSDFKTWVSDADPSRFLDASVQIDERGRDQHASTLTLGPIVMDAHVDDAGSTVDATVALGPNTLKMERVVVQGSVPGPSAN